MNHGSRRAGMVHAVTIHSCAADAAAGATGMAALVIHLDCVGVERLECSEEIVRAPCRGSSSSIRRVLLMSACVCYLHTIHSLQCKGRVMCACLRAVKAPRRLGRGLISTIPFTYRSINRSRPYGEVCRGVVRSSYIHIFDLGAWRRFELVLSHIGRMSMT